MNSKLFLSVAVFIGHVAQAHAGMLAETQSNSPGVKLRAGTSNLQTLTAEYLSATETPTIEELGNPTLKCSIASTKSDDLKDNSMVVRQVTIPAQAAYDIPATPAQDFPAIPEHDVPAQAEQNIPAVADHGPLFPGHPAQHIPAHAAEHISAQPARHIDAKPTQHIPAQPQKTISKLVMGDSWIKDIKPSQLEVFSNVTIGYDYIIRVAHNDLNIYSDAGDNLEILFRRKSNYFPLIVRNSTGITYAGYCYSK